MKKIRTCICSSSLINEWVQFSSKQNHVKQLYPLLSLQELKSWAIMVWADVYPWASEVDLSSQSQPIQPNPTNCRPNSVPISFLLSGRGLFGLKGFFRKCKENTNRRGMIGALLVHNSCALVVILSFPFNVYVLEGVLFRSQQRTYFFFFF
jgi:hypothetical protein